MAHPLIERPGLDRFLSDLLRRRWKWGETDCLMIVADWVWACRGFDPVSPFRGTYDDEAGAMAILDRYGGHEGMIDHVASRLGIARTAAPVQGDIAVVRAPGTMGVRHPAAICLGNKFFALASIDVGVVVARLPLVAAWTI